MNYLRQGIYPPGFFSSSSSFPFIYQVDIRNLNAKSAQTDANSARAGCSKVRTPPARPLQTHKPTDRTDYNTLRRS